MTRTTGPLGLLGLGALLLSLAACTSGAEVTTSQAATTRELVLVQGPDATSQALGHAYRDMLADAGIKARMADPATDPVGEVLAGRADFTAAGSSRLLTALGKLPGAHGADAPASGTSADASTDATAGPAGNASGAPGDLDAAQTKRELHALAPKGFAVLESADAERTGTLVLTAATSAGDQLVNTSELAPLCPQLEFGIAGGIKAELTSRLAAKLACHPKAVIELSDAQGRGVLPVISDEVQIQATTLENAGIPDNALVVLQGAEKLFAPESITPLITTDGVGQDAVKAINKLSSALKQEDLLNLNRMVTGRDALEPPKAADDWLTDKALVTNPK
ncbi:hypothetical protein [Paeniglutamicibacter psychrophenolicus]|uniref:hypothetical protein n=1 Tax=Paeniglutamicibacter psychrophenolicus TaxID=257454 RepID=UPI00278250EF|nr:hypothetical protein [Paeniglutamicibacter psychrophenolicus]MDQ0094577.1 glycine betaine/choline ABC-type transport system substrate-binding protein [Paeniglutamicibacter psychrophenolicus]